MNEQILKKIGVPAYAIVALGAIGVGFYIYKTVLESTKLKLDIKKLRRDLDDNGDGDGIVGRISRKLERV